MRDVNSLNQSPRIAGFVLWIVVLLFSVIMVMPVIALMVEALTSFSSDSVFSELADTVLSTYLLNSVSILLGTLLFAALFAILPAWWYARYEFVGRRWLQWLLIFPLAIPAYISAYFYTDLLDYAGPIQVALRELFGWQRPQDYWFPEIRSHWGASLMLALALYPYAYLLLRHAFANHSESLQQAAQTLGASPRRLFRTLHLPLARPALAIGATLIAMETLADYGTVHLFAISTLTTAIYDSWLVYNSLSTAAKLSCLMLLGIVLLVIWERLSRLRQRHYAQRGAFSPAQRVPAGTQRTLYIWVYSGLIILLGFVLPVASLISDSWLYFAENWTAELWQHGRTTFTLALFAALIATLIALLLNNQQRQHATRFTQLTLNSASLGYAIPGTVLAIGLLIPLTQLDIWINQGLSYFEKEAVGLILSGTGFALVLAYVIRFAAIANGSVQAAYQNIPANLDEASTLVGASAARTFRRIHWPLLAPSVMSAFLLVFIECVKELPASLLLRPFDFETLSTFVFQHASDEQLSHASLAALLIILVSLLPIGLLSRIYKLD